MPSARLPVCVVDTNVVFEGLTQSGRAAGLVIDAWLGGLIEVCVSDSLAYEYVDVLGRKLSPGRWSTLKPVVAALLERARFVTVYFTWRPLGPDQGDAQVIDCAMNAGAAVVTSNVRHFSLAQRALGLQVITPLELAQLLSREYP